MMIYGQTSQLGLRAQAHLIPVTNHRLQVARIARSRYSNKATSIFQTYASIGAHNRPWIMSSPSDSVVDSDEDDEAGYYTTTVPAPASAPMRLPPPGSYFTPVSSAGGAPPGSSIAPTSPKPWSPGLVVFSGGTAFNSVAGHLRHLTTRVAHVLPVSDDGGSTAEIVRVLGGPAVGDIRSRCLRLADDSDEEARAVKRLLAHRLPAYDAGAAKQEWYAIVEGDHALWRGVSDPYKHTIRAFLVQFHTAILAHNSGERFSFRNGSVGNFFFAGARIFFRSLEAAIFLFARVARLPEGSHVLPAISTEQRITLGAELEDGSVLRGQNEISHPPLPDDGSGPQEVDKGCAVPLPAPIRRVFYMAADEHKSNSQPRRDTGVGMVASSGSLAAMAPGGLCGQGEHEVFPSANPRVLQDINRCDAIIYGMGSLYTSICPTLCLEGMGEAIAARPVPKVMMLNGSHDRETACCGAHDGPMTAADMVQAVCDALNRRRTRRPGGRLRHPPGAFITGLLVPRGGAIRVDPAALSLLGVRHILEVDSYMDDQGRTNFEPGALVTRVDEILRLHWETAEAEAEAAAAAAAGAAAASGSSGSSSPKSSSRVKDESAASLQPAEEAAIAGNGGAVARQRMEAGGASGVGAAASGDNAAVGEQLAVGAQVADRSARPARVSFIGCSQQGD
ncbi:hypothetical protein Vretimale_1109 [Volvox reticuliferus]|uniref:Uncharacterized protein n=1 Tax=Volvox reticuliferus TaxID=1737510 RepID=A0A8J4FML0_9CHLO|nr:hypothetical protein Vretifemale_10408 [Volvox reticuliferus]GIL94994.1 hypothetical protein Vretimale_1109 [Volvox reticuliferus]